MLKIKILLLSTLIICLSLQAEITTDGSLGNRVNLNAPDYQITQDLGKRAGNNLFHSFETFDIFKGESATFSGDNGIQNVISRVTGGNASTINGVFRNTIPESESYFINPAGVMFGKNAQLDVQGSFHVSTADYLRLGENEKFHANLSKNSVLSVASPTAFGFLSNTPAPISTKNTTLAVPYSKTLSLIGGNLLLNGHSPILFDETGFMAVFADSRLSAQGGQINLVSAASQGEVVFNKSGLDLSAIGGKITLDKTLIETSGAGSGTVFILGRQLFTQDSIIQTNTLADQNGQNINLKLTESVNFNGDVLGIANNTLGQGHSGHLIILTPHLELNGSIISSGSVGLGKSGNITIDAQRIILKNGGAIRSDTYGPGQGGKIDLKATEIIALEGQRIGNIALPGGLILADYPSEISSDTYSSGKAGSINLTTDHLTLIGGFIAGTSFGEAQAGHLSIRANQATLTQGASISSSSIANGPGGNLDIVIADTLSITGKRNGTFSIHVGENTFEYINNQTVIAVAALGTAQGGQVSITVPTLIMKDSGTIAASTVSEGNGGDITVTVKDLYLTQGGQINNSSGGLLGSQLLIGTGAGGDIQVKATHSITASGFDKRGSQSGIVSNTLGPGKGGDILIDSPYLTLTHQGTVSANSFGLGNAGNLSIKANKINLSQNGEITTAALQAVGGNIEITSSNLLNLQNSQITTSVGSGKGDGGNITLNPNFIVMNNGKVIARAVGGDGGEIEITTLGIYKFPPESASPIDASSQFGVSGEVDIDSPDVDVSGGLLALSAEIIDASNQLQAPCSVQLSKNKSSFVVKRFAGSPSSPDDWQSNVLILLPENSEQTIDFKDESSNTTKNKNSKIMTVRKIACLK